MDCARIKLGFRGEKSRANRAIQAQPHIHKNWLLEYRFTYRRKQPPTSHLPTYEGISIFTYFGLREGDKFV